MLSFDRKEACSNMRVGQIAVPDMLGIIVVEDVQEAAT
jgi:hypothetical protein